MEISTVRDFVIVILGCLTIILVLGLMVGLFIVWRKVNKLLTTVNNIVRSVYRWVGVIRNLAGGLNQGMNFFKKGGG